MLILFFEIELKTSKGTFFNTSKLSYKSQVVNNLVNKIIINNIVKMSTIILEIDEFLVFSHPVALKSIFYLQIFY